MKIIYIADSVIPSRSANSIHVMKMCQAFANAGHEVILLHPNRKNEKEKDVSDIFSYYGVDRSFEILSLYYPNRIKGSFHFFGISSLIRILQMKPDVIYSRSLTAAFYSSFFHTKLIFEAHGPYHQRDKRRKKFMFRKIIKARSFQYLVVISEALKQIYKGDFREGFPIIVAHDAADHVHDLEKYSPWPGRKEPLQAGYFGHLYKGRGIEILIALAKRLSRMDFHIIGGNQTSIDYWQQKYPDIRNLFFHGFVSPAMVPKYRNRCDILLAPYQKDVYVSEINKLNTSSYMSPLKIFEYMSSNKAIIASDLPVLREILDESNSILVPPDDIAAWESAIITLSNKSIRKTLANKALSDLKTNYTWDIRAARVLEEFEQYL